MRVNPFHTTTPDEGAGHRDVYHDNNQCSDGKRIKPENRVSGTAGRPKCDGEASQLFPCGRAIAFAKIPLVRSRALRRWLLQRQRRRRPSSRKNFVNADRQSWASPS
jgi:hypothetical protein